MSVRDIVPIEEYTGNGAITRFDWDWDMVTESTISVRVDNENVTAYTTEDQSIIFDEAPESGAEIQIFRRTLIKMPEDYRAFGRFAGDKTELSVDRAILIAQERAGDRGPMNAPNGIVGGAGLSITRYEYDIWLISERGDNAVISSWASLGFVGEAPVDPTIPVDPSDPPDPPDPDGTPDPAILWAGDTIHSVNVTNDGVDPLARTTVTFWMTFLSASPATAACRYDNYGSFVYTDWLNTEASNNEYWMRVSMITPDPDRPVTIYSNTTLMQFDVPFLFEERAIGALNLGPGISLSTGSTAPDTAYAVVLVSICADDGGVPDGNWVSRNVILESIFNSA